METQTELILEPILQQTVRRKQLLPWWIKVFCILFMILGAFAPVGLAAGVFGARFELALFGFETNDPLTPVGLLISAVFILKGIVSYGLWNEKPWAVKLALIDAFISIGICVFSMAGILLWGYSSSIRLELVLLIPYLVKLKKIEPLWNGAPAQTNTSVG